MSTQRAGRLTPTVGYLVHLLGAVMVLLSGIHVLVDREVLAVELVEASILLVFAAAVFFVGHRAVAERLPAADVYRILIVSLGLGAIVGLLGTLFLLLRGITAEPTGEAWFILFISWCLGTSSGALVGYYFTAVERERAELELQTKRLTILQRVLRHNIRNEVTVVRGLLDDLTDSTDSADRRRRLDTVDAHVNRVHRLSENVQLLSELWKHGETEVVDLGAVTREEVEAFRRACPEVSVETDLPDGVSVEASRHLHLAIRETFDNAAVHNPTDELSVEVSIDVDEGAGRATLEVVDDGSHVPEEELAVLTSDRELPLQHVTGLGLWVIYWVLDASGGRAEFENREPEGVAVRLRLPVA
ncbi:sensor histidine kinase [Halorarum halobium]|uniref:sensor histidine kinase n=1 Tax=Halorarum halobium TaxID=3075121 RepID=UPI0028A8B5CC|nr:HAMP domain-containing sensor histidine kinase [Halobaculum sp. XH14]